MTINIEDYLYPGSPLFPDLPIIEDRDTFEKIRSDCNQGFYVQDAIALKLMDRAMIIVASLFSRIKEINKTFSCQPKDLGELGDGYNKALLLVNIAVRCQAEGKDRTRMYITKFDDPVKQYLLLHMDNAHALILQDWTCADLLNYATHNCYGSSHWYKIGANLAYFEFAAIAIVLAGYDITLGPIL